MSGASINLKEVANVKEYFVLFKKVIAIICPCMPGLAGSFKILEVHGNIKIKLKKVC